MAQRLCLWAVLVGALSVIKPLVVPGVDKKPWHIKKPLYNKSEGLPTKSQNIKETFLSNEKWN